MPAAGSSVTANEDQHEVRQDSMIVVKKKDGTTFFWDGLILRKEFHLLPLVLILCLSVEQIEESLRRSVFSEITEVICARLLFSMPRP